MSYMYHTGKASFTQWAMTRDVLEGAIPAPVGVVARQSSISISTANTLQQTLLVHLA